MIGHIGIALAKNAEEDAVSLMLDLICAFLNMIFRGDWSSASYPKRLNCYIRSVLQYLKKTMTNFGGCLLV